MGTFEVEFEVGDPEGRRFERLRGLVDTGSSYLFVPREVLDRLGVSATRTRRFVLASGQRVDYDAAWVAVRLNDETNPVLCVFGDRGSQPLVGAMVLETFGLGVDPLNERLVPVDMWLATAKLNRSEE